MLEKKMIQKLFITTLTMFIVLTIYTIPHTKKENVLRTNLEINSIDNVKTEPVYLQNQYGYLVKTNLMIDPNKIETIIQFLTEEKHHIEGLKGYIPKEARLIDYQINGKEILLNFSKEFLNTNSLSKVISGIVYSLTEQKEIEEVSFLIEGESLKEYQKKTRKMGINQENQLTSRRKVEEVNCYYLDDTGKYFVPVTKYVNDSKEKVEIIIEELKNTQNNLISLENIHTKLLDYREEGDLFFLNFNQSFLDENEESMNQLVLSIAYSIFDEYDVNMVIFEIENQKMKQIEKS